jgi:hypothetical protein
MFDDSGKFTCNLARKVHVQSTSISAEGCRKGVHGTKESLESRDGDPLADRG